MTKERKVLGRQGELVAAWFLRLKFYRILERNFCVRRGELDIVAERGGCLVFVEVKTRRSANYGHPGLAIDQRKRQRLCRAARMYLARHRLADRDCRFDAILVDLSRGWFRPKLQHIVNAFSVGGFGESGQSVVSKHTKD
jgi:putative endonuclease